MNEPLAVFSGIIDLLRIFLPIVGYVAFCMLMLAIFGVIKPPDEARRD